MTLVTKQIFKDLDCSYVKGTGCGYVYVLVNFVGYNNATFMKVFVKFWRDGFRNTVQPNTFTLLTKHLTVYITSIYNYKLYIISSSKVTWTSRIDNGPRCDIVNAGNYSMRPHAFSTGHFERETL